jgi:hypothetical protein
MEQSELLRYFTAVLEQLGLRYFVTGSMATIFFGEPRFTNDIDIVVDLPAGQISAFCRAFPSSDFYVSEETVRRAVTGKGQFNVIHPASGLKVDVMVPSPSAFNQSRFARARRLRPSPDFEAVFATAEDVILKKLEYYRDGGSEKHLRDIAGVLKISGAQIDLTYINEWSLQLGVSETWTKVRTAAGLDNADEV